MYSLRRFSTYCHVDWNFCLDNGHAKRFSSREELLDRIAHNEPDLYLVNVTALRIFGNVFAQVFGTKELLKIVEN